ncbi:MAG: trigger factor family protein [Actinobacteria bacterium]|nr:trigger factor family protein [Actinomycetota bacterium]
MQSTVEQLEGNKVKVEVTIDATSFEQDIDVAYRKLARQVRIPGLHKRSKTPYRSTSLKPSSSMTSTSSQPPRSTTCTAPKTTMARSRFTARWKYVRSSPSPATQVYELSFHQFRPASLKSTRSSTVNASAMAPSSTQRAPSQLVIK